MTIIQENFIVNEREVLKLNIYMYFFGGRDSQLTLEFLEPSVRRTPRGKGLSGDIVTYSNILYFLILLYHYNCAYPTKANTLLDPFHNFRQKQYKLKEHCINSGNKTLPGP